jgi:hypothetical protein
VDSLHPIPINFFFHPCAANLSFIFHEGAANLSFTIHKRKLQNSSNKKTFVHPKSTWQLTLHFQSTYAKVIIDLFIEIKTGSVEIRHH